MLIAHSPTLCWLNKKQSCLWIFFVNRYMHLFLQYQYCDHIHPFFGSLQHALHFLLVILRWINSPFLPWLVLGCALSSSCALASSPEAHCTFHPLFFWSALRLALSSWNALSLLLSSWRALHLSLSSWSTLHLSLSSWNTLRLSLSSWSTLRLSLSSWNTLNALRSLLKCYAP